MVAEYHSRSTVYSASSRGAARRTVFACSFALFVAQHLGVVHDGGGIGSSTAALTSRKSRDHSFPRRAEVLGHMPQVDHVESALLRLVLTDERLRDTHLQVVFRPDGLPHRQRTLHQCHVRPRRARRGAEEESRRRARCPCQRRSAPGDRDRRPRRRHTGVQGGGFLTLGQARYAFTKVTAAADGCGGVRLHDLRHTCASLRSVRGPT